MYIFLGVLVFLVVLTIFVLNLPVFGKNPTGERLERIKKLSNYQNGEFKNESFTPMLPEGISYWDILSKMIKGNPNSAPKSVIPTAIPDFTSSEKLKITWFGHSSYLIQVDGINMLVDPVFSERPSPFQFIGTKRFKGTGFIHPEDLPDLDLVLITHDHFDHLDYHGILKLKDKTKHFITSIGVGSHLEHWGIAKNQFTELAWGEKISPSANITLTAAPARHFSGRTFKRNQSLWSSFILQTNNNKIYIGGDSGYDLHFKTIGETYGPFDLAILECGQYNIMWPFIHLFPEDVAKVSLELNAKKLLPVHWGKYKLAIHDWDEPIKRLVKKAAELDVSLITPKIGETFILGENEPNVAWWLNL